MRNVACFLAISSFSATVALLPGCSSSSTDALDPKEQERTTGQSSFQSAPPVSQGGGGGRGDSSFGAETAPASANDGAGKASAAPTRQVEETDLYRLEGDRLYYLNGYRGLMVFDVSNVDQPRLVGRSAIYGTPVEMIVRDGIATVVVADWYGRLDDGTPFHGSVVRGLDARDPANIKVLGEARLGGWVRDTRVVGDVLYAVSQDYGWAYGMWADGYHGGGGVAVGAADTVSVVGGGGGGGSKVVVSSVSFGGGQIKERGRQDFPGYSGIFNVTAKSILLAHDIPQNPAQPYSGSSGRSELQYIDISDPGGQINLRGKAEVNGSIQGWGQDNGRWNLDFADGKTAHVLGCAGQYCGQGGFVLSTVDFTQPNTPARKSELAINALSNGYGLAARFDGTRMYVSTDSQGGSGGSTPFQVYDLGDPAAPRLAGSTTLTGQVFSFIPNGNKVFALGNDYGNGTGGNKITLRYLDVTDPSKPSVVGTSSFGEGWAWTPAAGTFKAFTKDDAKGLVVLPFSGWSSKAQGYENGLQLIEFTPTSLRTAGAAKTRGWVERGIFVKDRLVSLSDLTLSVVDYANRDAPRVVNEVTLARNVVNVRPDGASVAELSSDWWDNDLTKTQMRVLPIQNAEENTHAKSVTLDIDGVNARAYRNGALTYVVTNTRVAVPCSSYGGSGGTDIGKGPMPSEPGGTAPTCYTYTPQVQVVELQGDSAKLRGKIQLPIDPKRQGGYSGWGWSGCYYYDWYNGDDVVQVQGNVLAFRQWHPTYNDDGTWTAEQKLQVIDLANPDAPQVASTVITDDSKAWWGNMRAVGDKLYTSHYEWISYPTYDRNSGKTLGQGVVRYYLDQIDLSDRARPKVGQRINVPGLLVGASETDPSVLYTMDYRWYGDTTKDELAVVRLKGDRAYLESSTLLDGWAGSTFVRGNKAYLSAYRYVEPNKPEDRSAGPRVSLHEVDLTDPKKPVDRQSTEKRGWGWLLGVEGDRAMITSGWGNQGIDVYRLTPNAAPTYDQFVRTRGWYTSSLARQGDTLFLASGYWGTQTVRLQ